jgi:ribosomal protein L24E
MVHNISPRKPNRRRSKKPCEFCAKTFNGTSTQRFCSSSCRKASAYRRTRGVEIQKKRDCKKCLTPFKPRSFNHVFCSNKCRRLYHLHGHPGYNILRDKLFAELEPRLQHFDNTLQKILDELKGRK